MPSSKDMVWVRNSPYHLPRSNKMNRLLGKRAKTKATELGSLSSVKDTDEGLAASAAASQDSSDNSGAMVSLSNGERVRGALALSLVPIIWGTYSPIIRFVYQLDTPPPSPLLNFFFYVASVTTLLVTNTIKQQPLLPSRQTMTAGFELGLWLFLGSTLQLMGLKFTTGSQAAIIVQLTTVFVPLLEAGFFGKKLSKNLWTGVALAFTGAALVATDQATNNGLDGSSLLQMAKGDALVLAAAIMYSTHVLRLDTYAKQVEPLQLATGKQTAQLIFSTAFAWAPAILSSSRMIEYRDFASAQTHDTITVILAVAIWNGAVSSAFTSYAQSYGQRRLSPTVAGLLFTTQPLWAALLSSLFLHEPIGKLGICGIALVLAALSQSLVPITGSTTESERAK